MKTDNFNLEKFRNDVYEYFNLNKDKSKYDKSIKNFIESSPFNHSSFWRVMNGKSKNINSIHIDLCLRMGVNIQKYFE